MAKEVNEFQSREVIDKEPSLDIDGRIATIKFQNPGFSNRLSPGHLDTLDKYIDIINSDMNILVLRFIASGKYFCSGYDLSSLISDDAPSSLYFGEIMDKIEQIRPITIAVIQGGAYGGGTDLCLACDFRIGTPEANMFMPASRFGLHFYISGIRRYISRLGMNNAKYLFLTAEKIYAQKMLDIGFLTELVDSKDLMARVDELSKKLASMAPVALTGIKKEFNDLVNGFSDKQRNAELVKTSENSSDLKEAISALREKRKPKFN